MNDFLKAVIYGGLFAVPFLTLFVVDSYFFPFITGKNFAFRILVEITVVAWLLLALRDVSFRPRFSWLLPSAGVLLLVMFAANMLGIHPDTSFWSNYERMDGYITLVHVFLYALVLGSFLKTKQQWIVFLNTTLTVALIAALYGLSQYFGLSSTSTTRIESYLGNAAYMAIYMLFHIFIAFWLFVESRSNLVRVGYALVAAIFIYTLLGTGTRGTAIGLLAGGLSMALYFIVFGRAYPLFRRYATGIFIFLTLAAVTFYVARDSALIQNNSNLARIANIDLAEDLKVRGTIWGMAWEGVKERPLLGYGQGNFNYVFNEKYDPFLYNQEQWFDRAHNIVMDWLIAGGFLGLLAYLSIFVVCLYYLVWVPWRRPEDQTFTALERGVLFGILVGYFTHNLVVFDNIVSYIFFAVILALLHSRVGVEIPRFKTWKIDDALFKQFAFPVAVVALAGLVYTLNVPGMQAAGDIIDGYRAQDPKERLAAFERALARGSFAHQEITEQITQQAMSMAGTAEVPEEVRQGFVTLAETELKRLAAEKPGDARVHVFFSTFYRAIGNNELALEQVKLAREFSPRKPSIIMQEAIIEYSRGNNDAARDLFAEAFHLDERHLEARVYYAALLFKTGEAEAAKALATTTEQLKAFAQTDFLIRTLTENNDNNDYLIDLFKLRLEDKPDSAQNWASLAFLYYQIGDRENAITTLTDAGKAIPGFAKMATCISDNIAAGREPQVGCQ